MIQLFLNEPAGNRQAAMRTGVKRAFTLIELLVVIAIIALLAAILFPVFARARENARRTACLSNMKQIGLGIMQYIQDYDGRYPQIYSANPGTPPDGQVFFAGFWSWQQIIYPYVKSDQVYFCPSSPARPGANIASLGSPNPYATMLNGNYGYNDGVSGENAAGMKEAAILDASGTYMILEYGNYEAAPVYTYSSAGSFYLPGAGLYGVDCGPVSSTPEFVDDCKNGRHFGGITIAFADGHAKWLRGDKVIAEGKNANGAFNPKVNH